MDPLADLGLMDVLDWDPRPAFVLDMEATISAGQGAVQPVHCNPAMINADSGRLLDAIMGRDAASPSSNFHSWASLRHTNAIISSYENHFVSFGFTWVRIVMQGRWNLISGTSNTIVVDTSRPNNRTQPEDPETTSSIRSLSPRPMNIEGNQQNASFDWTGEALPMKASPHIQFARNIRWNQTPLGPLDTWSNQLRNMANLVMKDPGPAVIFWGPTLVMIYNEPYVELLGGLHPGCMGVSARVGLAEVWHHLEHIIDRNLAGEAVEEVDTPVFLMRSGFLEETFFSKKFIPILDTTGATVGHYERVVETTRQKISQRRLATLLALSEGVAKAPDLDAYWALVTEGLSHNEKDLPFALLYSLADSDDFLPEETGSASPKPFGSHKKCILRGSLGATKDYTAAPSSLDLQSDNGFMPYFREAMHSRDPTVVQLNQGTLAAELVKGLKWRGFGDPSRTLVISPITATLSDDTVLGFLVFGMNPRRPYDEDYRHFILVASRLLSTSLNSIMLHLEDIERQKKAISRAAGMEVQLIQQLRMSQKEVERNSLKFQRFAERADIGTFILGLDGVYSYRNEAWFGIFQPKDRDVVLGDAWVELIDDDYAKVGQEKFELLMDEKKHQSFELRLKRTWNAPNSAHDDSGHEKQPMWIICSVFPELSDNGEVVEIVGCVTDISRQKWGEKMQSARASDAQESKRQLENFIDTTSHEMRNPLSAIVQCADSIISSHKGPNRLSIGQSIPASFLETTIEAAETIVQCSQHMKCIVDDVLTMSKLDSGLLVMTPVDVRPEVIARHAVKMFEREAKSADVGLDFRLEDSYRESNVDWVSLDPTRLLQILINLITNAIKFTRLEVNKRRVFVSIGLSVERPAYTAHGDLSYIRMLEAAESQQLQADWSKGEIVYITFTVKDTGRGLSDKEKEVLFSRFSQASPRTHIHYGGSGLGLFISRRLTEMHGGAIGFASTAGLGSIFSFYIKTRKSAGPLPQAEETNSAVHCVREQTSFDSNKSSAGLENPTGLAVARRVSGDQRALDKLHVLVVEDNLVNQRVLAKQLRSLGIKVAVANHGGEALEYLQTTMFCVDNGIELSLILMDWEMPIMDGLTCVSKIRELQKDGSVRGHVPVVAVTANVRSEQVQHAIEAGMDDVVSKPFRILELCKRMRNILRSLES